MEVLVKPGVCFREINEHTIRLFNVLSALGLLLGIPRTITSANDGEHQGSAPAGKASNSLHNVNRAWDVRSKDLTEREKLEALAFMKQELGPDWDCLLEKMGEPGEHFHTEYQPK